MSKQPFIPISLSIVRYNKKGFGVGSYQKENSSHVHKVEVPFSIIGDALVAEIGKKRRGSYVGTLLEVTSQGQDRVQARCAHALECGGCSWQQMAYSAQCREKQKQIEALFSPMASPNTVFHPILSCDEPWAYRNKMEFSFSQNKEGEKFLGLVKAASKGRVFSLTECHLTSTWFAKALSLVRTWWTESDLFAYHRENNTGSLRTITLREGIRTGHKMAVLTVSGNPDFALKKEHVDSFVRALKQSVEEKDREKLSIFIQIQQAVKGMTTQFYEWHLAGPDYLSEELHIRANGKVRTLRFKISPTAFFQPNTLQAERLYARALEMAGDSPYEHVMDLYAGTATLSLVFSQLAKQVSAIEINPHATFDAEVNKEWNDISNVKVHWGDVGQVLSKLIEDPSFIKPDLVVVDPARSGLNAMALETIIKLSPKKIIYISCHPQTQAENGLELKKAGYHLKEVQPVDQFPHTIHIENLTLWQKEE